MSLTQYEIYEACKRGELFTIDNVRIVSMETTCPPGCNRAQIGCVVRVGSNKESVLNDVDLDNIHIYKKTKYDPCRKLKIGDVVRVLKINGNLPKCQWAGNIPKEGVTGIVRELRKEDHFVWIDCKEIVGYCIDPAYLELVTPVEELEPYFVQENQNVVEVLSHEDEEVPATVFFKSKHKNARERAEAERDRLNAEYRKEQLKNG